MQWNKELSKTAGNESLENLIHKLDLVDKELSGVKRRSEIKEYSKELGRVTKGSPTPLIDTGSSQLILSDVLHSLNLVTLGSDYFKIEPSAVEKQNFDEDFMKTLKDTQMNTAKKLLTRIKKETKTEDK